MIRLMLPLDDFNVKQSENLGCDTSRRSGLRGFDGGFQNTEGPIDGGADKSCLYRLVKG